jgi:1-aminocyclopropane-1-carboxylate deaminase
MLTASDLLARFSDPATLSRSTLDRLPDTFLTHAPGSLSAKPPTGSGAETAAPVRLYLKRDDLLHPAVSGNKWRKLKYNLARFRAANNEPVLTFGGAYSNHLHATAAAGLLFDFQTIGLVRGDELRHRPLNPTLHFCRHAGMRLHFLTRPDYRALTDPARQTNPALLRELFDRYGPANILPEGGTDPHGLAAQGVAELMPELVRQLGHPPDWVCCAVGTGGTLAGLRQAAPPNTNLLGINVVTNQPDHPDQTGAYTFGGYGKTTPALLAFIELFQTQTGIPIEPTYTGKLLYALHDLARQGHFAPDSTVVALHTGGVFFNDE